MIDDVHPQIDNNNTEEEFKVVYLAYIKQQITHQYETQAAFSEKIGMNRQRLNQILQGTGSTPRVRELIKIAQGLGYDSREIFPSIVERQIMAKKLEIKEGCL